jgi:hypothetical protein
MDQWIKSIFFFARVDERGRCLVVQFFSMGGLERLNGLPWHRRIDCATMCEKAVCGRERGKAGGKEHGDMTNSTNVCVCVSWGVLFYFIFNLFYSLSVWTGM